MKITILALHLGYGGIEKFISNISNMFIEDNEVEIISIYKLYDKPPFYINPRVKITYLLENWKPNRDEFYKSIKKFNIVEFIKQSYIALKILYLKKYKMKEAIKNITSDVVISTIIPHNKLLSKYGNKNIKKIATEHNYNDKNEKYINKVVKSCKNMDYLVIASKKLANMYEKIMKDCKCKVINIPLGLDYIPEKVSKLDTKNITFVGRLSEEKGVIDLIDIFKKVHNKDKETILNIIGDGELKDSMILKVQYQHLENNVIFHGYKTKEEMEDILLNTCIGINTSYTESFGLAVIEMFSYGIPCISFNTAEGTKELIDNAQNGYIIDKRNFDIMADKIIQLINDRNLIKQFGENARKKSREFETKKIKLKWLKLLN